MNLKTEESKLQHKLLKATIILIILGIITVILMLIPYLSFFSAQINKLSMILNLSPKTLKLLILLILMLCWALYFLLKIIKKSKKKKSQRRYKTKKQQLNDKIIILNSIKKSDKWYLHCKYQYLNLRESELDKYIKILLKQKYIKPNGIFTIRSIIETPIYVLTQKGLKLLDKHKNDL